MAERQTARLTYDARCRRRRTRPPWRQVRGRRRCHKAQVPARATTAARSGRDCSTPQRCPQGARGRLSRATARDLRDRLAELAHAPAPAGYSPDQWPDAVAGAVAFSEQWTEVALQLGWSPADLFGLHPVAPAARLDCKGLAWMLERGAKVVELSAEAATISSNHRRPAALLQTAGQQRSSSPVTKRHGERAAETEQDAPPVDLLRLQGQADCSIQTCAPAKSENL